MEQIPRIFKSFFEKWMLNQKRLNLRKSTKLVHIFKKEQNCTVSGYKTRFLKSGKTQK